ncbi:MAG: quinone-dependent dihydroorotate dehydrogenase [Patescibacteria group bacterium]|nr:quinone-dependent dihydroorotate dehydrogenase [Patescibacteria group bacterium]
MTIIERIYKGLVRPRIFAASVNDAEIAHLWGLKQLERLQSSRIASALAERFLVHADPIFETTVFGLKFTNPFGLAAGYDKYCQVYWGGVPLCGWGFTEVGTITMLDQPGNPRPRMLRSLKHRAIYNAMGFNNPGAGQAALTMATNPPVRSGSVVGVSLGKSAKTPITQAAQDYVYSIETLAEEADYLAINVSSPNTVGLRQLQQLDAFNNLLSACMQANVMTAAKNMFTPRPLGIKLSPNETDETIADIVSVCRKHKVAFIIATNTTTNREGCDGWDIPADRGGVSGQPLKERAKEVLVFLRRELKGEIPLIGVGGVASGDDLYERITLGADLVQALTAWPFEGPDFVKRALKRLAFLLRRDGFHHVSEAVGTAL